MIKSIFLIFIFTLFFINKLNCQINKNTSPWISLFADKASNINSEDTKRADSLRLSSKTYLLKIKVNINSFLFKQSNVAVERQLDKQWYVVKTTETWVNKNKGLLDYVNISNNNWKLSPSLIKDSAVLKSKQKFIFHITVYDVNTFNSFLQKNLDEVNITHIYPDIKTFRIETTYSFMESHLLPLDNVFFIENGNRIAKEESIILNFDNTVNTINLVHASYPDINGSGLTVSVKENKFNPTDIDLVDRITETAISSNIISSHATNVATIIAGGGNSFYLGKGIAWGAKVSSADFKVLLPDDSAYKQYNISVQNHSYGVGIENFYGNDALAYDKSMITNPSLLHIFSSGNIGDQSSQDGPYKGITGFANLTGSFKMAKNIITIGSINSFGVVPLLSSKGPAYDGRLKPELVAYGESGSSEASAVASGIALLLQDTYAKYHYGSLPDNMLVKAVMINSADDVGSKGINFSAGYGSINANRAIQNLRANNFFFSNVDQGEEKSFNLNIPSNAMNLKLTLTWNDPPATPNAYKSLVNDLDLKLTNLLTRQEWMPWVLNSFPNLDSLQTLPVRNRDSLNVVEQVTLENPLPGQYEVKVKAKSLLSSSQSFYVAYQWDTVNHFKWTYPTNNDNFTSGANNVFRWDNQFLNQKGRLEYSIDKGITWNLIDPVINLSNNYYQWNTLDTFVLAVARMIIGNNIYPSDTFTISKPTVLNVGFDCGDSVMLYWNKIPGIKNFTIFSLYEKYLSPLAYSSDTSIIVSKKTFGSPYFAVATVIDNKSNTIKSYTINTRLQGVDCYIKNFLADFQSDSSAKITLTLGTNFNVKLIYFEKQSTEGWTTLQIVQPGLGVIYRSNDKKLTNGINNYRVKIELLNGNIIYTNTVPVNYFKKDDFIVFPHPIYKQQSLEVLSKDLLGNTMILYDLFGRKVRQQKINSIHETISLKNISRGTYILVVLKNDMKEIYLKKIIVL